MTIQFVRFCYKGKEAINAKILKDVKFPLDFDAFELCTSELQQKLIPMREKFKEVEDSLVTKSREVKNQNNESKENKTKEPYWFEDGT